MPIKNAFTSTVNFVQKHKVAIALGVAATAVIVIQQAGIRSLNEFIEAKGLTDEYYSLDEI